MNTPSKTITTEIVGADWTPARQIFDHLQIHLRLGLAGQVLLGAELQRLKKELGFTHGGKRKKASRQSGDLKTWPEHLAKEMPGLPDRTADRFVNLADGCRARLKKLGHTKALALFDQSSSELDAAQRELLTTLTSKICFGETQSTILEELKIVKIAKRVLPTDNTPNGEIKLKPTMVQLAFALFASPVQDLCALRTHSDYEKALYALPLVATDDDPVSLTSMEHHYQALLEDIQEAKAAAIKSAQS